MAVERVVLVGFMGAGKSAVGRRLAGRLGWDFYDVDTVVEERQGRSISEIFTQEGEAAFRAAEVEAAGDVLARSRVVVATGGGWPTKEGRLESLPPGSLSVWLSVGAREALRRVGADAVHRPLLDVPDPAETARLLLENRYSYYALADARVDTEGRSVDDVTTRILEILEEHEFEYGAE